MHRYAQVTSDNIAAHRTAMIAKTFMAKDPYLQGYSGDLVEVQSNYR